MSARRAHLIAAVLGVSSVLSETAAAQVAPTDSTPRVSIGAFVDSYFAWDFGRPPSFDRSFAGGAVFTTQPARHNEFNVNLAFVEIKLDAPHYRGRLALQTGTSVASNYASEPTTGTVSGPSLSRIIQEAVVGVQVARNLWVDAGVFFSHIGMEGWISRDNPIYTRSLVAEYSPYYQSGAKLTWTPSRFVTAQVDVVNGWQNIAENNQGKGVGMRVDVTPDEGTTLSYFNLFTPENGARLRTLNGVGLKRTHGAFTVLTEFDIGTQAHNDRTGTRSGWAGWTLVARAQSTPQVAFTGRLEGFRDPDGVIVATGAVRDGNRLTANPPFRGLGASVGADVTPYPHVLWRSELRAWQNDAAVFPNGRAGSPIRSNAMVVTSLALSF